MVTLTSTPAGPAPPTPRRHESARAAAVLALRWLLLVGSTIVAFHRSVASVLDDLVQGAGLQYLPAVWVYALVAAIWTYLRRARSIDIHDRETDVIVGLLCCGFAVLSATLLGRPLSGVYYLWRIDLLQMCVFAFGASVVLFGLRRTLYYRWAWLTLLLSWPLVGRVVLYTVGNGQSAALALLHLAAVVSMPLVLRRGGDRLWYLPSLLGVLVGLGVLPLLDLPEHPGRLVVPALAAAVVGLAVPAVRAARTRRSVGQPVLRWPTVQSPTVQRPWGAVAVLVAITLVGAVTIPAGPVVTDPVAVPVNPDATAPGPIAPPGWVQTSDVDFPKPASLFGSGAAWRRYRIQATNEAPQADAIDSLGRDRTVVVDVLTTRRPRSLVTFPAVVTYPMGRLNLTSDESVPIGSGVTATVDAAVDTDQQLTWTMVSFAIALPARLALPRTEDGPTQVLQGESQVYQRVTVIAVDDHEPGAPFPEPTNALLDSIRAAAAHIVRGSTGGGGGASQPKDRDLLVALAEQVLAQRQAGSR